VSAQEADLYRRLVATIGRHLGAGGLVAGPDSPEVYFLAGRAAQDGALFDALARADSSSTAEAVLEVDADAAVFVLNHKPEFSPAPSPEVIAQVRRGFPEGEHVGRYEVRWR
jgi:hypothetical protein